MWFVCPRCWLLLGQTLPLLVQAGILRLRPRPRLRLPPVHPRPRLSVREALTLAEQVNRITTLFAGNSRHACWYRSYPLAVMLRRQGLSLRLNIGLGCLSLGPGQVRGHAWLDLNGAPFNELPDAPSASRAFAHLLADNGAGVRYWVAAGRDRGLAGKRAALVEEQVLKQARKRGRARNVRFYIKLRIFKTSVFVNAGIFWH